MGSAGAPTAPSCISTTAAPVACTSLTSTPPPASHGIDARWWRSSSPAPRRTVSRSTTEAISGWRCTAVGRCITIRPRGNSLARLNFRLPRQHRVRSATWTAARCLSRPAASSSTRRRLQASPTQDGCSGSRASARTGRAATSTRDRFPDEPPGQTQTRRRQTMAAPAKRGRPGKDAADRGPETVSRPGSAKQSAAAPSPFPPIADFAFLSDCHTGALVAPDGSIDWLCVPRFDAPSVFGTLLDRQAGSFRLGPFGINVPSARIYEPGTNMLLTTWKTPTGWAGVRDALTLGPRRGVDQITPHTRPRADEDADHLLVRVAFCLEGEVEMELTCEPVFDYGRLPAQWSVEEDANTADASGEELTIRLRTDMALGAEGDRVRARHTLKQGEEIYCSLSWEDEFAGPESVDEANARLAATARFWRGWLSRARIPDHRWSDPIQRSALAIKGLTYMPTGATVAALTTSLPETPGGARNWDYRYTWLRDSTFTLQALHYLNLDWEAEEFMQF